MKDKDKSPLNGDVTLGKEVDKKKPHVKKVTHGSKKNHFGVSTVEALEHKLNNMTSTELKTYGISVGALPSGRRSATKARIIAEFKRFLNQ